MNGAIHMEEKSFKKYIILWLSQSVSGLGSSMTGFALILWAYGQSHSAMSVSLMSFCNYVPYVFLSLFAGSFIDRHKKKTIMLVSDSIALGTVNACMGMGGIVGGIIVSVKKESRQKAVAIYVPAAVSFLFGDLMMAVGKNVFWWSAAAVAASLPFPFIMANQNTILYRKIPAPMRGRVFAVRNAIQYSTIPAGIILGGWLADYVFEPFIVSGSRLAKMLGTIVGNGAGSGMAVMFLCTGICGFVVSVASCFNREIKKLS